MCKEAKNSPVFIHPEPYPEKPIPQNIYPVIDTDLARDNLENDLTEADKQDL